MNKKEKPMNRSLPVIWLAIAWLWAPSLLHAQAYPRPGNPNAPPVFSPYLNLLRGGNPAFNYYGLVRPEMEWRNSVRSLQQQINQLPGTLGVEEPGAGLVTGHPIQFMSLSHYFPNAPGSQRGASGRTAVAPTYPTGTPAATTPPRGSRR
jgi:hypothetical protein